MCAECLRVLMVNQVAPITGCAFPPDIKTPEWVLILEYMRTRLFRDHRHWACGNCYKEGRIEDVATARSNLGPVETVLEDHFDYWHDLFRSEWECQKCGHRVCARPRHCVMKNSLCEGRKGILYWVNEYEWPEWNLSWEWYKEEGEWTLRPQNPYDADVMRGVERWLSRLPRSWWKLKEISEETLPTGRND